MAILQYYIKMFFIQGLEYRWVQTGKLTADGPITALSWNLEGTRLLTGGKILQLWHQASLYQEDSQRKYRQVPIHNVSVDG